MGEHKDEFEKDLAAGCKTLAEVHSKSKVENIAISEFTRTPTDPAVQKDIDDLKAALANKMNNRHRWGQRFERAEDGGSHPSYRSLSTHAEKASVQRSMGENQTK